MKFPLFVGMLALGAASLQASPQPEFSLKDVTAGLYVNEWTPPSVSGDGEYMLYQGTFGYGFIFARTSDGKPEEITMTLGVANKNSLEYAWAPQGAIIALNDKDEGKCELAVLDVASKQQRTVLRYPKRMVGVWNAVGTLDWAPGGRYLYLICRLDLPRYKQPPALDNPPWHNNDVEIEVSNVGKAVDTPARYDVEADLARSRRWLEQFKRYPTAHGESDCSVIAICDTATGDLRLFARGNDINRVYPSPDGKSVALVQEKTTSPGKELYKTKQLVADIFILPTREFNALPQLDLETYNVREIGMFDAEGKAHEPALRDIEVPPSFRGRGDAKNTHLAWAPDSASFVYTTMGEKATGDIFVYSLAEHSLHCLTDQLELPEWSRGDGYAQYYQKRKLLTDRFGRYALPSWTPDSKALLAVARGELWYVPLAKTEKPRMLRNNLPFETRAVLAEHESCRAVVDEEGAFFVVGKDADTRCDSILRLKLDDPEWQVAARTDRWWKERISGNVAKRQVIFWAQNPRTCTEIFRADLGRSAHVEQLTHYKDGLLAKKWPEVRYVSYTLKNGRTAHGYMYLPDGASAEKQVPLVMRVSWSYEDEYADSVVDWVFAEGAPWLGREDGVGGGLTARQDGVATFYVDLPLTPRGKPQEPRDEFVEGLNAAYDAAIQTKCIAADKVALVANTFDGVTGQDMVLIGAALCPQFKTAIVRDGWGNLLGRHNTVWLHQGRDSDYFENDPGRMGVSFWQDPQRYARNISYSYLDRIKMPVLILASYRTEIRSDYQQPYCYDWPANVALRERNVPVGIVISRVGRDRGERERDWLYHYLLGRPFVTHLAAMPSSLPGGQAVQSLGSNP